MAKDPALLFYSQDFYVGTAVMNFEDRGKYITILCLMHQQGRMSEETIRLLVGSVSVTLKSKFKVDDNGMWYNERLEKEVENRKNFVETRRNNGKLGGRPKKEKPLGYPNGYPLGVPNEDENEDENDFNKGHDFFGSKILSDLGKEQREAIEQYTKKKISKSIVDAFNLFLKTDVKYHVHYSEWHRHLRNWLKKQSPDQKGNGAAYKKLD